MKHFFVVALLLFVAPVWALAESAYVENSVSVSASSGGNRASGQSDSSGGTVTTGNARTSASVETTVHGDDVQNVEVDIETEGEEVSVERYVATSTAGGEVRTEVRVSASATSSRGGEPEPRLGLSGELGLGLEVEDFDKSLSQVLEWLDDDLDALERAVDEVEGGSATVKFVRRIIRYVFGWIPF